VGFYFKGVLDMKEQTSNNSHQLSIKELQALLPLLKVEFWDLAK